MPCVSMRVVGKDFRHSIRANVPNATVIFAFSATKGTVDTVFFIAKILSFAWIVAFMCLAMTNAETVE